MITRSRSYLYLARTALDDDVTTFTDVTSLLRVCLGSSGVAGLEVVLFVRHDVIMFEIERRLLGMKKSKERERSQRVVAFYTAEEGRYAFSFLGFACYYSCPLDLNVSAVQI